MIRRAEKKDIPGIQQLLEQVLAIHHAGRPDIFKPVGVKYTEIQMLEIFADADKPVFVYTDENDNVVGHCFGIWMRRKEAEHTCAYNTLYIDDLCVDEAARRKGIGAALYEYVRNYAVENGAHNITLHAWDCNPSAVAFYKKQGMQIQQYTMEEIL